MADQGHPRVHPVVDPEVPATAPLVPEGATSDKGDPVEQHLPPPSRRMFPVMQQPAPKKRRCCSCCRCLCWTVSILILLVIIIAAVVGILYLVFQPKIPSYTIDRLTITEFSMNSTNSSLSAKFIIRLKTYNPNKKIGIYYEDGSNLTAWYTTTKLCEGTLPVFYQGHQNTTILDVELSGEVQDGTTLLQELYQEQQSGSIPLILDAKVPIKLKVGKLKLMKMKPHVRCDVVVDSLTSNSSIRIKSSSCKLKLKL